ncbi:MAG: HAD-IIB family hydrolase [Burkholderiales bacterium]|nr:HAD-IIB family hydrolase [Burkholderiales bacterium]
MSHYPLSRSTYPKPIADLPIKVAAEIEYVFTDIDDTITDGGKLLPETFTAIAALQNAGFKVIPVTGRPAGWCDMIARQWPVDAIVGENGAFYMWWDKASKKLSTYHVLDQNERIVYAQRLLQIKELLIKEYPKIVFASDQFSRLYDLAIDVKEDVQPYSAKDIETLLQFLAAYEVTAKLSSIHVNLWLGHWDKLSTTKLMMKNLFHKDLEICNQTCLFIGDSPNDDPMFSYFKNSFGVANVLDYRDRIKFLPKWVTESKGGKGFSELSEVLIRSKSSASNNVNRS